MRDARATIWGTDDWVREFYTHYTIWNGTVHEMGHILRWHYGTESSDRDPWAEETAVNDLAVAYWRARGETERLAYFECQGRLTFDPDRRWLLTYPHRSTHNLAARFAKVLAASSSQAEHHLRHLARINTLTN